MFTGMISHVIVGVYDVSTSLENIQCICCIRQSSERFLNTAKVTRTKRTKVAFYGQEFLIEILKLIGKFYTCQFWLCRPVCPTDRSGVVCFVHDRNDGVFE